MLVKHLGFFCLFKTVNKAADGRDTRRRHILWEKKPQSAYKNVGNPQLVITKLSLKSY